MRSLRVIPNCCIVVIALVRHLQATRSDRTHRRRLQWLTSVDVLTRDDFVSAALDRLINDCQVLVIRGDMGPLLTVAGILSIRRKTAHAGEPPKRRGD
jgi:hypothetical protein